MSASYAFLINRTLILKILCLLRI